MAYLQFFLRTKLGHRASNFRNEKDWIVTKALLASGFMGDEPFNNPFEEIQKLAPSRQRKAANKSGLARRFWDRIHESQYFAIAFLISGR